MVHGHFGLYHFRWSIEPAVENGTISGKASHQRLSDEQKLALLITISVDPFAICM